MSRNRYQNLLKCLHFNSNATRPFDSTDKLRPIHNKVVANWCILYNPDEQISIVGGGGGVLKWKGQLYFRVCNKNKSTKYGIKAYILANSNCGYC